MFKNKKNILESELSLRVISKRFFVPFPFSQLPGFVWTFQIEYQTYSKIQEHTNLENQTRKIVTAVAKLRLYIYNRYELDRGVQLLGGSESNRTKSSCFLRRSVAHH